MGIEDDYKIVHDALDSRVVNGKAAHEALDRIKASKPIMVDASMARSSRQPAGENFGPVCDAEGKPTATTKTMLGAKKMRVFIKRICRGLRQFGGFYSVHWVSFGRATFKKEGELIYVWEAGWVPLCGSRVTWCFAMRLLQEMGKL